jgi:hypothetical protein
MEGCCSLCLTCWVAVTDSTGFTASGVEDTHDMGFCIARGVVAHSVVICRELPPEMKGCCSLCLTCWVEDTDSTGLSAYGVEDTHDMGFCIARWVVARSMVICVVCWVLVTPRIDSWGENSFEPH